MAYVERITSGKKTFYYLGKTIRLGPHQWKKIRIKLGTKKPTREEVAAQLHKLRLEEYRTHNDKYIDAEKLEFIDDFKEAYNHFLQTVPKTTIEKEKADFLVRFTYNSNAIEGNRLTLRDTFMILKEKQIPSGALPKDYNEAINGRDAFEYLNKYNGKLTIIFIEKLNEILAKNTGVLYPGRIRFFPVKIEGTDFIPPDEKEVPRLLKELITFYYQNKRKIHSFVLACLIHTRFVEIHPFEDGNGRTGRALMNWVLMKAKYPKLYIPVKQREKYYRAIDYHNEKKYKESYNLFFDIMKEQLSTK